MKKIILLYLATIKAVSICFAQEITNETSAEIKFKKSEINLGFTNLFNNRSWIEELIEYETLYDYSGDYGYLLFSNARRYGIGYKLHSQKGALRAYFDYGISRFDNKSTDKTTSTNYNNSPVDKKEEDSWESNLLTGRLGYEFIINLNRIDFYFGADLIYQRSDYTTANNSEYVYKNYPYTGDSYTEINTNTTKGNFFAFGAGPVLGIRLRFNELVSVSTETRMDFTNYKVKGTNSDSFSRIGTGSYFTSYSSTTTGSFSNSGYKSQVSPLGMVSLNVHF